MKIRYIPLEDVPPEWDPSIDDNIVLAESNGVVIIKSDERGLLWVVEHGVLVATYESTHFAEGDGPALAEEAAAFLEVEDEGE